jgi:Arc/MetJ-type ribon-helix-helix transcriptional regulator
MKTISVDLPDNLATAVDTYVEAGFFDSELDVLLAAVTEFVRRNRIDLVEQFAHEDIEWAKNETRETIPVALGV